MYVSYWSYNKDERTCFLRTFSWTVIKISENINVFVNSVKYIFIEKKSTLKNQEIELEFENVSKWSSKFLLRVFDCDNCKFHIKSKSYSFSNNGFLLNNLKFLKWFFLCEPFARQSYFSWGFSKVKETYLPI